MVNMLNTLPHYYHSIKCMQRPKTQELFKFRGLRAIHNWKKLSLARTNMYAATTSSISLVVWKEEIISSIQYHYTYIHWTKSRKQTSVFTGIPYRQRLEFYISASHSFTIQLYTPFPQPTLDPLHTLCTMRIMWVVLIFLHECVCVLIVSVACQAPANVSPTSVQKPRW